MRENAEDVLPIYSPRRIVEKSRENPWKIFISIVHGRESRATRGVPRRLLAFESDACKFADEFAMSLRGTRSSRQDRGKRRITCNIKLRRVPCGDFLHQTIPTWSALMYFLSFSSFLYFSSFISDEYPPSLINPPATLNKFELLVELPVRRDWCARACTKRAARG